MSEKILGAQLFTVRDSIRNEADFRVTMRRIRDMGYRAAQYSGYGDISPECVRDAAAETGIHIDLTHTPFARISGETDKVFAEHDVFDCDDIGIGWVPDMLNTRESCDKVVADFNSVVPAFRAAGKKLLYHNHNKEFQRIGDKTALELIIEGTDPDTVFITFDVYWSMAGGYDPAAFIRKYGSRIRCLHLKDMGIIDGNIVMTEVGSGNINFDAIMEEADKAGVTYYEVECDTPQIDPFESLRISHDYIKSRYGLK